jgi:hypothetical protein
MDLRRLAAAAAAIAATIGIPGVGPASAAPADPPPVDPGALGPGGAMGDAPAPRVRNPIPPGPYTPQPPVHRQGAAGPKGGGGVPSYAGPRPIHLYTPPPPPPPGG